MAKTALMMKAARPPKFKVRGMDINIVTTARTDEDAKALLTHLGMPFRES